MPTTKKKGKAVAKAPLTKPSPDRRTYQCVLDSATIPDGAFLQGAWNTSGAVTGVRAIVSGNVVVHQCGTGLPGTVTGGKVSQKWLGVTDG